MVLRSVLREKALSSWGNAGSEKVPDTEVPAVAVVLSGLKESRMDIFQN